MSTAVNTAEDVKSWLTENGFPEYASTFYDNQIDGEVLLCLTERALETLIPIIGHRMKFLKLLESLNKGSQDSDKVEEAPASTARGTESVPSESMDVDRVEKTSEPQKQSRKRPAGSQGPAISSKGGAQVILNAKKPWPVPLTLPTQLRPDVLRTLKNGEKIKGSQRASLIRSCYDHFSLYTVYPTSEQLNAVSEAIVKSYPALKDESNIGTGYDSWFTQLRDKFRNERKNLQAHPEVIIRKKIKSDPGCLVSSKLRRGGLNWEPPYPEGEDEASMKKHKEMLQNEWARRSPNKEKIENWMLLTFPERRRQMNKQIEIRDIKAEYPALFDFTQIVAEFERILGLGTSILDTFRANMEQASDSIIKMAKLKRGKDIDKVKNLLSLLDVDDEPEDLLEPSTGEKAEVAVAVLPYLLQARAGACQHKDFVQFISDEADAKKIAQEREKIFPFLIFGGSLQTPGTIHLAADKQILCSFEGTLVEAALALLATFYVFMFNYPPGLNNFYLYLQKCILDIQDGKKLPSTVISFVNSLHESVSSNTVAANDEAQC